jgi:hypothetical protein
MQEQVRAFFQKYLGKDCPPWTWPLVVSFITTGLFHIDSFWAVLFYITGLLSGLLIAAMAYLHKS